MDKKSKIFLAVFFLSIVASIGFTYYQIIVRRDYVIEAQTDCDPAVDKCFVYHCDPAVEKCTGDGEQDTSYYKISRRKANMIPGCDPKDENCQPFVCGENEQNCEEIFCNEQAKQQGEECNDPVRYVIDNPPAAEEESELVDDEASACDSAQDPTCEDSATSTTDPATDAAGDNSPADAIGGSADATNSGDTGVAKPNVPVIPANSANSTKPAVIPSKIPANIQ